MVNGSVLNPSCLDDFKGDLMRAGVRMRRMFGGGWWACAWLTVSVLSGCGGGSTGPVRPQFKGDTVPVSGTVTLDGEPLSGAAVTFVLQPGGTYIEGFTGSGGQTDSSGKYVLRSGDKTGTPPGRYKVYISLMATADGTPFKEDPEHGIDLEQARLSGAVKEKVPAKFSDPDKTALTREITADQKDSVNFDLKSK
jgi:hypothetical protein